MLEEILQIQSSFSSEIEDVDSLSKLTTLREKYLSRKRGLITLLMKELQNVLGGERRELGQSLNVFKAKVENAIEKREKELASLALDRRLEADRIDFTLPGNQRPLGHL